MRVLAAVALLAGLVLTHGLWCADGMASAALVHPHAATASIMDMASTDGVSVVASGVDAHVGSTPSGYAGLFGACMGLLTAVLFAVAVLGSDGVWSWRLRTGTLPPVGRSPRTGVALSLSQLCVLRT